jgi:GTP-binding protein EngB required for normal cell division
MAQDARDLQARLASGHVFLACIGQFKRGKSTLVNALIGQPLLPTGVAPVTSAITTVAFGPAAARVHFESGGVEAISLTDISTYVSERDNPGNRRGVRVVDVTAPADILRDGLCLVDTPGIGSVFGANTDVTRAFVPRIDAALVVIGADPPLSGDELTLVGDVLHETQSLILVLNKADRLPPEERREACEFARRVLHERLGLHVDRIFEVSAAQALAGTADVEWAAFAAAVRSFAGARHEVLAFHAARRSSALSTELLSVIGLREEMLQRPIEDSDRRIAELRHAADAAVQSIHDLSALLASEQARLVSALEAKRVAFLEHARHLHNERLADRVDSAPPEADLHAFALEAARHLALASVTSWGAGLERDAEELYRRAMARFTRLAADFLRRTGSLRDGWWTDGHADTDVSLDAPPRFYFTELLSSAPSAPLGVAERLLPASIRRQHAVEAGAAYLERLLETNAARFTNDLIERISVSRRQLETRVREALANSVRRAEEARAAAQQLRAAGAAQVEAEHARLADARSRLESLDIVEPTTTQVTQ